MIVPFGMEVGMVPALSLFKTVVQFIYFEDPFIQINYCTEERLEHYGDLK